MKSLLVILLLLAYAGSANASALPTDSTSTLVDRTAALLIMEEGKQLFNEGQTRQALIKFRQAYAKDKYSSKATYWVSRCHYELNNYGYAKKYALTSIALDEDPEEEVYFFLGAAMHRQGNLDSAILYYEIAERKMSKTKAKNLGLGESINACLLAKEWESKETKFEKKIIEGMVNSGYDDYAPLVCKEGTVLYFTSRRNDTKGGGINPDDEKYYEDIYRAKWNAATNSWDSITNDMDRLNSEGFDALSYISEDGINALLTLNNEYSDKKSTTRVSDICEVEFSDKKRWGTPKIIKNKSINSSFYDGAATMTADGSTMYFVSDRNGKKSMTDIYVAYKNGKKWGEPKMLKDSINTPGRETTPYITPDGRYLFFASDGHDGIGGYDMFVSENLGGSWSTPVNLGPEFNSVNDDTHFAYYPKLNKAYFVSFTLTGKKASRDIYEIDLEGFEIPAK